MMSPGEQVIAWGLTQAGKPYSGPIVGQPESARWGDPGYDCSSFVASAYKQVGVTLPAFTDAIAGAAPEMVKAQARRGDIILYRYHDPYQPNVRYPHTGLWYGPGEMLSCDYGAGVGIHPIMAEPYEIHRPPLQETPMPEFAIGPGFKTAIDARGWHPAGPEVYFAQVDDQGRLVDAPTVKYSMVECEEGLLWYSNVSNKVGAIPFS